jgi:glucose/arabinose dehydrogenase
MEALWNSIDALLGLSATKAEELSRTLVNIFIITLSAAFLAACGDAAKLPEEVSIGPNPVIPAPYTSYIPTVNIAPAKGWPAGGKPRAAAGLLVNEFAKGLEHPRWLFVLPNGDVLVAESDGPKRPEDGKGPKGWIYQTVQKWAGSNTQSADQITLLRDKDHDGVAETRSTFLKNLHWDRPGARRSSPPES